MRGDEELKPIADRCAEWFVERFLDCFGIDAEPEAIKATDLSLGQTQVDLRWSGIVWNVLFDPDWNDDERFMLCDAADENWCNSDDFASTAAGIMLHDAQTWRERFEDLNSSIGWALARELP